ncbi:MAG: ATP-dependent DNA ligase [Bacilli bacterium]
MREVLNIINLIANTSSRNEKEAILREHKDNKLFKDILYFVFNPYILTGISSKKIKKNIKLNEGRNIYDIYDLMNYLKENNTGKDIDIFSVQSFIKGEPEEYRNFITQMVTKDLIIGITADTINKIYGDFIPTFSVMLAKKFDEHKEKVKDSFVITKKLDGNRLVIIKENGIVKSFTRQGNQYDGLEEIESDFKNLYLDNIVFDGELIADTEGDTLEIYAETTSKARKKQSNKTGLLFHVFDVLPLSEFTKGKSSLNCIDRKLFLTSLFNTQELPHCREVEPLYIGNDLSKIDKLMGFAREQRWEGLMINLDTPYVCKRTDTILKVKVMQTCDLRIIGFEEGTGKNEGKLGALLVDYKGFTVGVGSGFSDFDREYIWRNKNEYFGRIVEIQYFEESKNQDGGISLRFPVFKNLRIDKTKPSYN